MCLNIVDCDFLKSHKARKPIVCYKLIRLKTDDDGVPRLRSWFYDFHYELGKTYTEKGFKRVVADPWHQVNVGFHSFANEDEAHREASIFDWGSDDVLVRCEIPAGSHYFKGKYILADAYCSESLRITGLKHYTVHKHGWEETWQEPEVKPSLFKRIAYAIRIFVNSYVLDVFD